ncbi:hypothetical protein [Helicobacter sp. T3_23-1059]
MFIFTLRLSNESKNLKSAILAKNSRFLDSRGLNQFLPFRFNLWQIATRFTRI